MVLFSSLCLNWPEFISVDLHFIFSVVAKLCLQPKNNTLTKRIFAVKMFDSSSEPN